MAGYSSGCFFVSPGHIDVPNALLPLLSGADFQIQMRGGHGTSASDIYWGALANTSINDAMGCKWEHSSLTYKAFVRVASSETLSATGISGANDTNDHTITVTSTGAGSVSCSIDGGAAVTATATLPTFTITRLGMYTAGTGPGWVREGTLSMGGR